MKRLPVIFLLLAPVGVYGFTGVFSGWESFTNPAVPLDSEANNLSVGIIGTTPTRIYFYYNLLGKFVFTHGAATGSLGWGMDMGAGLGYRFMNPAYKRSGWDLGMDLFAYFNPYFLNSETGYTDTVLYYGAGLGFNSIYKINPHIGIGLRAALKYNIGIKHLASKQSDQGGVLFSIGALLTF